MKSYMLVLCICCICHASGIAQNTTLNISRELQLFWDKDSVNTDIKIRAKKFKKGNKEIVFFGTKHNIRNISDEMFAQMGREIKQLAPDVIFIEPSNIILLNTKEETVEMQGDAGFCAYTANENNIEVKRWGLPINDLYYQLLKEYSEQEVSELLLLIFYLRDVPYTNYTESSKSFWASLLSTYEQEGLPIKPAQKDTSYFLKPYQKYFGVAFDSLQFDLIYTIPLLRKFYSSYQQLRDKHLIETLEENLKVHDKVFIQGGSAHLGSLEKIIPIILDEAVNRKKQYPAIAIKVNKLASPYSAKKGASVIRSHNGSHNLVLCGTDHNIMVEDDPQFGTIRKEILELKPDLILTQGFGILYPTAAQTIKQIGDVGYCRYLGTKDNIRVSSWEPVWDEVHDYLAKKYKPADIYFSLMGYTLLRDTSRLNRIRDINSYLLDSISTLLISAGYSFKRDSFEINYCGGLGSYLNLTIANKYSNPRPLPSNPSGAKIEIEEDGYWRFTAEKPGNYEYNITECAYNQTSDCPYVILKLSVENARPDSIVTQTGYINNPLVHFTQKDFKEVVAKSIKLEIIHDMHLFRANKLLEAIRKYQKQYNRIFIQADSFYINSIREAVQKL